MAQCKFEGCEADAKCRGWCLTHYGNLRNRGLLDAVPKCGAPGCKANAWFRGFCKQDFLVFREHCRLNSSWSAANEREWEALSSGVPLPVRESWTYEGNEKALAEITEQQEQTNGAK